ncbi:MAG: PD-(D/E)XK nuclease family protein [Nanoarchaeota archaeon]|nr:PD-(D/E)XK nuclease family protein [Nanoarchaeota archaeon]
MPTYSYSKISCFEQCPLKFKFQYIDKIKTEIEQTIEAFLGGIVHEALEKLYTDLKFQKVMKINEFLDFYNDLWQKNWNDAIVIVKKGYDKENYRKMGEKFLTDYYNHYKPFDQGNVLGLETTEFIDLDDKYKFHVRIDRLNEADDGAYEIHDYKTGGYLPEQTKFDEDRQLALYSLWILKKFDNVKRIKLIWHYLAFDKEIVSERTQDQLMNLRRETIKAINKIESAKDFPSVVTKLCDWCNFRPICPHFKHLYRIETLEPKEYLEDDGVKLVNDYAKIQGKIKELGEELEKVRQTLIDFAKKEDVDVVFGSDIKASISSYESFKFPSKDERGELNETIKQLGLWNQLAVVDTYELAKRIKNKELHEDFIKLLDKFIKKEKTDIIRLSKSSNNNNNC